MNPRYFRPAIASPSTGSGQAPAPQGFPIRDAVRHELSWTHYRTHQDIGQMDMYVGIILCAGKDASVVRDNPPKDPKQMLADRQHSQGNRERYS